jgi:hypothetical protein
MDETLTIWMKLITMWMKLSRRVIKNKTWIENG